MQFRNAKSLKTEAAKKKGHLNKVHHHNGMNILQTLDVICQISKF